MGGRFALKYLEAKAMKIFYLTLCLLAVVGGAAGAQEDRKDELVAALRGINGDNFSAEVISRFLTIEATQAWWDRLLDPATSRDGPMHEMTNLASMIVSVASNLGLGDAVEVDRNSTYDGKGPLFLGMLDSWKGKVGVHLVLDFAPDEASAATAITNIDSVLVPFSSPTYCKPRGGKFQATLRFNPKATDYKLSVSKDGTTYDVIFPIHAEISQSYFEESLKLGR